MKKIFLIIISFAFIYSSNAQSSYIILNGGITNPVGEFADNDFYNEDAGFASGGYNLGFEIGYFFNPWIGLGGSFKFNSSNFDTDGINAHLQEQYWSQYDTLYLASSEYNMQNFLIGPYAKLDITGNFSLFGKFFIGVMSAFRPDQTLNWQEDPSQELKTLFIESKLASSFAWNIGGGLLFRFTDRLGLVLMADYIAGNPKYDEFNYDELIVETNKQEMHYFNFNIGLAIKMN